LLGWGGIAITMALVTCAMLCKEQGITVVGICFIYDLCIVNKVNICQRGACFPLVSEVEQTSSITSITKTPVCLF